jgi:hypothetical protein
MLGSKWAGNPPLLNSPIWSISAGDSDFDIGSVLAAEVLAALIGFASLSLAVMLNEARFAKSSEAHHANPSLA